MDVLALRRWAGGGVGVIISLDGAMAFGLDGE